MHTCYNLEKMGTPQTRTWEEAGAGLAAWRVGGRALRASVLCVAWGRAGAGRQPVIFFLFFFKFGKGSGAIFWFVSFALV